MKESTHRLGFHRGKKNVFLTSSDPVAMADPFLICSSKISVDFHEVKNQNFIFLPE